METVIFAIFGICSVTLICTICVLKSMQDAAEVTMQMYHLLLKNSVTNDMIIADMRLALKRADADKKDGEQ